jgi:hypothetical protein
MALEPTVWLEKEAGRGTRAERRERRRWSAGEVLAREGKKGRQEQAGLREKEARATELFLFLLFFSFSFLH